MRNYTLRDKLQPLVDKICLFTRADPSIIDLKTRKAEIVLTRQLVMFYLMLDDNTKLTLAQAGGVFGKDHATCLHACKTINNRIETDSRIRAYHEGNKLEIRKIIKRASGDVAANYRDTINDILNQLEINLFHNIY